MRFRRGRVGLQGKKTLVPYILFDIRTVEQNGTDNDIIIAMWLLNVDFGGVEGGGGCVDLSRP